jgi:probable addiction module antidote protein/putative addiction module killer protein
MTIRTTEGFYDWLDASGGRSARARIQVRIDRLTHGNPGDHRHLGDSVSELRIDVGPGYRVYYPLRGEDLIFLLAGVISRPKNGTSDELSNLARIFRGANAVPRTSKPKKTKTVPSEVAEGLRTPEEMAAYLDAWLTEAPDDRAGIARALGDIARAKGMTQLAQETGLSRENLQQALGEGDNPSFATIMKIMKALGLRLHAEVVHELS